MTEEPKTRRYPARVVLWVGAILAIPLWRELHIPGETPWNVFLAVALTGLVTGAYFGIRYLQTHEIEVGEARFDTTDSGR